MIIPTFKSLIHFISELVEPTPLRFSFRDRILIHPASTREPVEVGARIHSYIHSIQDTLSLT